MLPSVDPNRQPQITFLGPTEKWRIAKQEWKSLFQLNIDSAYEALRIWKGLKNQFFDDVEVVDNKEMREALENEAKLLSEQAITTDDDDPTTDDEKQPSTKEDTEGNQSSTTYSLLHSAVLPRPLLAATGNPSLDAILDITDGTGPKVSLCVISVTCDLSHE